MKSDRYPAAPRYPIGSKQKQKIHREDMFMNLGRLVVPSSWRSFAVPTSVSIIAVLVIVVYALMFGVYRVNLAIDTPWYLSFSYNYCLRGIDTDVTFGDQFPATGMGGTVAFGKLAAMVQCAALAPFDWSLVGAAAPDFWTAG
jgi:hypothetical protein